MNWEKIGEFLPLLIFLALWALGKFFSKSEQTDEAAADPEYYEEEENIYREPVEETIRRKIAERQHETTMPEELQDAQVSLGPATLEPSSSATPAVMEYPHEDAFAEQKQLLKTTQASVRKIQKKLANLAPPESQDTFPYRTVGPTKATRYGLEEWHRNPESLRRAFVHYEVFGAPLSLRRPDGSFRPLWQE